MPVSFEHIPTSQLIRAVLADAPAENVTLSWLLENLRRRSFGMIMLFLGLIAIIPGVCILAGFELTTLGFQMMMAHEAPILPRGIAQRPIPTRRIAQILYRIVPMIIILERYIRPRWHTPFVVTKRFVGLVVLMLAVTVFLPIPLSNIIPGGLIMLVAFAYLEEDGILLTIALSASVASLAITVTEVWAAIWGAGFLLQM